MNAADGAAAERAPSARSVSSAAAIALSAFLLFALEPLVGKRLLPMFGGAPTVWATVLCFFQIVLLLGYTYAHVSVRRFGRAGRAIHVALAAIAAVLLAFAPEVGLDVRGSPTLDLLGVLVVQVGAPTLVLTATTPLVSAWYRERGFGDPYRLFAVSNAGSLLALFAYPLAIEPFLGLGAQRTALLVGYGLLVVALAAAARARPRTAAPIVETRAPVSEPPIAHARRARWLLLAAVPSGLVSALTAFLATDLVSAPLVWTLPLGLYIASFIVAFGRRGARATRLATIAAPGMVTLLWVLYGASTGPVLALLPIELAAFGVVALALHGALARDLPGPTRSTEFYLVVSAGGAAGSMFVALFAPRAFPDLWEYPALLLAALVALALAGPRERPRELRAILVDIAGRLGPYVVGAGLLALVLVGGGSRDRQIGLLSLVVGGLILLLSTRPWVLVASTATALVLGAFALRPKVVYRARSFFGVSEVRRTHDGEVSTLYSGTTLHGSQWRDDARRRARTTYFGAGSPIEDVFAVASASERAVAVVGLGAGTLATFAREGDAFTFFEIDPVVVHVASTPTLFTYLADAPTPPRIVVGDARLSLRAEPAEAFDVVVLDAFSSDVLPVHLVTVEGLTIATRTLRADGVLAIQISNRFYDLAPPLSAALDRLGIPPLLRAGERSATADADLTLPSRWLAATRDPEKLAALRAVGWTAAPIGTRPFTDDYADLLSTLRLAGFARADRGVGR